jgi:hypothetical protein
VVERGIINLARKSTIIVYRWMGRGAYDQTDRLIVGR